MDSIQALAMAMAIKDTCGSKLQIDATKIQKANDKMEPYRNSEIMGKEEERVLEENMKSFNSEVQSFRSCMAGANRGYGTSGAISVSFGGKFPFFVLLPSCEQFLIRTICKQIYLDDSFYSLSVEFKNGEAGIAFTTTGDGRKLFFMGYCDEIGFDAETGISLNIGLWRNIEDIPGESHGFGLGFDLQPPGPALTVGAGVELLWNKPQGEFIGVTVNFGIAAGLSPIDVSYFVCNTPLTLYMGGKLYRVFYNDVSYFEGFLQYL